MEPRGASAVHTGAQDPTLTIRRVAKLHAHQAGGEKPDAAPHAPTVLLL